MGDRWVDELMPDQPLWVRDLVDQELRRRDHQISELQDRLKVMDTYFSRLFPIMNGPSIPWSMIAPHEHQALANHSQTLECLARRGGLDPTEALAVIEDRPLPRVFDLEKDRARLVDLERAYFYRGMYEWEKVKNGKTAGS